MQCMSKDGEEMQKQINIGFCAWGLDKEGEKVAFTAYFLQPTKVE